MHPIDRLRTFDPALETGFVVSADGVTLAAAHDPGPREIGFVIVHGFTGSWQRPATRAIARGLARHGGVVSFDLRGHGGSGGRSTVGECEILDLDAVVNWARSLGYRRIVTVGFSLGSSVVLRHAANCGGVDAVISVSGASRWYVRDTRPMRLVMFAIEKPAGRLYARLVCHTRISSHAWDPVPESPVEAIGRIAAIPLLIVHGDQDRYFGLEHPQALAAAAPGAELWIEPGYGHAENASSPELIDRIGRWASKQMAGTPG